METIDSSVAGPPWLLNPHESVAVNADQMRTRATSRVLAAEAADHPDVTAFREIVLGQQLVAFEDMPAWIEERGRQDGEPTWWLKEIAVPADALRMEPGGWAVVREGLRIQPLRGVEVEGALCQYRHVVTFNTPPLSSRPGLPLGREERPVALGGALDRLRLLADEFEYTYFWRPEQSTAFVLTGLVPYAYRYEEELVRKRRRKMPAMSEKHMQLGVFASERPHGEPLSIRMSAWNELFPDWAYGRINTFGWDSQEAIRRLVGEFLDRPLNHDSRWGRDVQRLMPYYEHQSTHVDIMDLINNVLRHPSGQEDRTAQP